MVVYLVTFDYSLGYMRDNDASWYLFIRIVLVKKYVDVSNDDNERILYLSDRVPFYLRWCIGLPSL